MSVRPLVVGTQGLDLSLFSDLPRRSASDPAPAKRTLRSGVRQALKAVAALLHRRQARKPDLAERPIGTSRQTVQGCGHD